MKKLSIIIAAGSLALATPVFACPGHDDSGAPKTAEKAPAPAKDQKGTADKAPAKDAKAPAKDTSTAKAPAPSKDQPKKPDKVSQK